MRPSGYRMVGPCLRAGAISRLQGQAESAEPLGESGHADIIDSITHATSVGDQRWRDTLVWFDTLVGRELEREVLVSSIVKDLVAGSGISFEDRGLRVLKGVPDQWRLFSVTL
jgi:hypothetical protein